MTDPIASVASAVRMRVGVAVVDPDTREILMPGARAAFRVTPKAMSVLMLLAETPGRVLSRQELLSLVWPDTLPTDDVLTQAIAQLRKAFGAGAGKGEEGRRYIETIAKNGYRLTVEVTALGVEADPAPTVEAEVIAGGAIVAGDRTGAGLATALAATHDGAEPDVTATAIAKAAVPEAMSALPGDAGLPASISTDTGGPAAIAAASEASHASRAAMAGTERASSIGGKRWLLAAAVLAVAAILAVLIVLLGPGRPEAGKPVATGPLQPVSPDRPYRLITTTAGFEMSPSLSPDASMVAFSSRVSAVRGQASIRVQTTDNAPSRALTSGAEDVLPVWSPLGHQIAFARLNDRRDCAIFLVSAAGGDEREVARCDNSELPSFDWSADGRALLFGSMSGDPGGRGIRRLDPGSGQWQAIDYDLADGEVDYQPKESPDGRWIAFVRSPQMGDLWRIPAQGGKAERLTHLGAEIRGLAWLPDSRTLVFGMRVDTESRLYRLDTTTGTMQDLGLDDAQGPAVAAKGGLMAFVHRNPQFGIYRVGLGARAGEGKQQLFASSGRDAQPVVSPTGTELVFASDRAGRLELWWADLRAPDSLRPMSGIHPDTQQPASWTVDGQHVLVSGWNAEGEWISAEITPRSGRLTPLPIPGERVLQAIDIGDPRRLLVLQESGQGGTQLVLYDRTGTPWRPLSTVQGVSQARYDAAGNSVLFTRLDASGLWRIDPGLDTARLTRAVEDQPTRWRYRSWAVDSTGGLAYLRPDRDCNSLLGLSRSGRVSAETSERQCLDPDANNAVNGFSIDMRNNVAYVALAPSDGTDIGIMPTPRGAAPREGDGLTY
ncbi:winged helix-turn-helix domain-containing protein [Luteimonas sp. RIT-PG2_3]|jgi:Tol biopolymer transport system component/DNA-binding winged helix-turn-helix (wHTH) protein